MKHVILAQSCSMIFIILYSINYLAIAAPSGSNSVEFGVNLGQVPPELLDSLFDDAKYLGVSWVRVDLSWKDMERQRGLRDYSLIETIVSKAESKGLRVLLLLTSPPDWVLKPSFDLEAWRVFVMETVEKLGGHISAWQVMNEPDSPYVNPIPPHLYVEILGTAYDIIKKAGGKGPVVSAAFTPIGTKYVEELHRLGGSKYFDVLALNAYGPSPSASAAVASTFKELLNKLGLGGKPVWITEVGWPISGEGLYGLLKGVGEREQADNLASVFCLLSSIQGVEKIFWFKLMDGPTGLEETPYWGLMATPEQKRPAYHVYREAVLWLNRPSRMVKLSATTNNILVNDSVMFSLLTDPPTGAIRWKVYTRSNIAASPIQIGLAFNGERINWRPELPGEYTVYAAWEQGCAASESNKVEIIVRPAASEQTRDFVGYIVPVALAVSIAVPLFYLQRRFKQRRVGLNSLMTLGIVLVIFWSLYFG